jgi:hypothetical protein
MGKLYTPIAGPAIVLCALAVASCGGATNTCPEGHSACEELKHEEEGRSSAELDRRVARITAKRMTEPQAVREVGEQQQEGESAAEARKDVRETTYWGIMRYCLVDAQSCRGQ